MTLETIYYIGQTIAVGAILISLIAIYWQQRQANIIARTENAEVLGGNYADTLKAVMENEDLATIFRKVMFGEGDLTPVEQTRILIYFSIMLSGHRSIWGASQNGLLADMNMKDMDANTAWYLTRPLFRAEWKRLRANGQFGGGFGDHVDGLMSGGAILSPEDMGRPDA